jgi:oligopeptide transport system ATP-binding protein
VTPPVLSVEGLEKRFPVARPLSSRLRRQPPQAVTAVDGVSLYVERGRILGVVGESGCGKTTLARCMVRLVEPDAGTIHVDGTDVRALEGGELRRMRGRIQMVFQDPYTSLNPGLTIGAAIGEAARVHGTAERGQEDEYVRETLELVGLSPDLARHSPKALSGGQRQRAAVARALAVKPDVLIADEAVSALDVSSQAQILNLLRRLTDELGLATVFIAHQLAVIAHVADHVAVMYLGQVVERGPTAEVFGSPQHPYTRALLDAHPEPSVAERRPEPAVKGDIPSPLAMPSGCRFRTRCPYAEERCHEPPAVERVGPDHEARCVVLPFAAGASKG